MISKPGLSSWYPFATLAMQRRLIYAIYALCHSCNPLEARIAINDSTGRGEDNLTADWMWDPSRHARSGWKRYQETSMRNRCITVLILRYCIYPIASDVPFAIWFVVVDSGTTYLWIFWNSLSLEYTRITLLFWPREVESFQTRQRQRWRITVKSFDLWKKTPRVRKVCARAVGGWNGGGGQSLVDRKERCGNGRS